MVRKYFLQQLGLLIMVSVIMVLTNIPVSYTHLDVYKRQV